VDWALLCFGFLRQYCEVVKSAVFQQLTDRLLDETMDDSCMQKTRAATINR